MPLFKSRGYAQGKYNPGGSRKRTTKGKALYGQRTRYSKVSTRYSKGSRSGSKSVSRKQVKSLKSISSNDLAKVLLKNQLSVVRYPFSTATKYPKYPDGKVDLSIGLPFNYSRKVSLPLGFNTCVIHLFPGITDCATIYAVKDTPDSNGQYEVSMLSQGHFIQHCLPFVESARSNTTSPEKPSEIVEPTEDWRMLNYTLTGYSGYRYVSCGLRLGSDSMYLKNGGSWEALRVPVGKVNDEFMLNTDTDTPNFHHVTPAQLRTHFTAENPSYQTGSMKQLGNYEFRLKRDVIEHDFVSIPEKVDIDYAHTRYEGSNIEKDGIDKGVKFDYIADKAMDQIFIRLTFADSHEREFSYHCSANVEMRPYHHGNFNHFATETVKLSENGLDKIRREMEKYHRHPGVYNANKYSKKSYN